jgi:RimJ/RimL family protein N-acetyltransferase
MIYAERIRLRAMERADVPYCVEWLNDPEVTAGLLLNLPLAAWDEMRWFENLANRPAAERPLAIEARLPDGGWKYIGNLGLEDISSTHRSATFGIFIGDKSYWNSGYGTEATRLIVKHGFGTLNLNRISLTVYETNPRAIRAYEKVGFVREGVQRQAIYRDGRYLDLILMSILRAEWESPRSVAEQDALKGNQV